MWWTRRGDTESVDDECAVWYWSQGFEAFVLD